MKLGYAILHVGSALDTVAFHERAFGLERGMVAPPGAYGEMKTGETRPAFAASSLVQTLTDLSFEAASLETPAPPLESGLVTDAVEEAFDRAVQAGAVTARQPHRTPWGQLVGYVRANAGVLIEICSPLPG